MYEDVGGRVMQNKHKYVPISSGRVGKQAHDEEHADRVHDDGDDLEEVDELRERRLLGRELAH